MEDSKDLAPIIIDLGIHRRGELNESWLAMFGGAIEMILGKMFGSPSSPVKVRGTRNEIDSFSKTLRGEKKYIEAAARYGLDDPRTYKNKYKLDQAIKNFERTTGIKWAFKKP